MATLGWDVNHEARSALAVVVIEHGVAALSDPQLLGGLLADFMPSSPREKSVLVAAADADVAGLLRDRQAQHVSTGAAVTQAAAMLEERTGLSPEACRWAAGLMAEMISAPMDAPTQPDPGPSPYPPTQTLPLLQPPQPGPSPDPRLAPPPQPGPVFYPQTAPPLEPGPVFYPQPAPPPQPGPSPYPQPAPPPQPSPQPPPRPSPQRDSRLSPSAGHGPALVSGSAALICALSVPLQLLGHDLVDMPYGWDISLSGLILFIAALLTLQGRYRSVGIGLIFGATLAVVSVFAEDSVLSGFGGGYVAASILTTVTALIAAIGSIVFFAPQIRASNLREPLAVAYVLVAIGLVVANIPGFLQFQVDSAWFTGTGLVGPGVHGRFLFAGVVSVVALVLPAVVAGLLPAGTGVRAGVIIGWLAVIAAELIDASLAAATLAGVRPAPAFYVSWAFWFIALALGVVLLASNRTRRMVSAPPTPVS